MAMVTSARTGFGYPSYWKANEKNGQTAWTSGRTGIATSDSAPNAIHFTAPPNFKGMKGRWTPEDPKYRSISTNFGDELVTSSNLLRPTNFLGLPMNGLQAHPNVGFELRLPKLAIRPVSESQMFQSPLSFAVI